MLINNRKRGLEIVENEVQKIVKRKFRKQKKWRLIKSRKGSLEIVENEVWKIVEKVFRKQQKFRKVEKEVQKQQKMSLENSRKVFFLNIRKSLEIVKIEVQKKL